MANLKRKLIIEDVGMNNEHNANLLVEQSGDSVTLIIQETKRGGRTYHTKAKVNLETWQRMCREIANSEKTPN